MNTATATAQAAGRNRRESFRMNDRVALSARALSETEFRQLKDSASERFQKRRILNGIIAAREAQRSALRAIRDDDPTLGAYLESIEERLESLARLLSVQDPTTADRPTHEVNLSGSGIRFPSAESVNRGDRMLVELRLFPSRTCLTLLGTVVRCTEMKKPSRQGARYLVAVDFTDIHEDDRELLIRHVHTLQMDYVRRGALRS